MDTITKKNVGKVELEVIQKPIPALYIPASYYKERVSGNYLILKRVMDIFISSVMIAGVLSWLYPLLAILIRLSSKGPVLFVQKRMGLNGQAFNCLKFRTMIISEDADITETRVNDKRITGIGKWLRKTYIDELPQLINVLKGEMSIVGPRPHMLFHHHKFCSEIPAYDRRHLVKPGITGLSQVKGYHGSMYDSYRIHGRTKLDLFYVCKISFKLDLMILVRTLFIVLPFHKKNK